MQSILSHVPQWVLALSLLLTTVMTLLTGIGNLFPNTKFGAWCLHAGSDIRRALGMVPVQPPAEPPAAPPTAPGGQA